MSDTALEDALASALRVEAGSVPAIPAAEGVAPQPIGPTFVIGEYTFPLPVPNPTSGVSAGALLNLLTIALAASGNEKVYEVMKAAKVEVVDVYGKRFFPPKEVS